MRRRGVSLLPGADAPQRISSSSTSNTSTLCGECCRRPGRHRPVRSVRAGATWSRRSSVAALRPSRRSRRPPGTRPAGHAGRSCRIRCRRSGCRGSGCARYPRGKAWRPRQCSALRTAGPRAARSRLRAWRSRPGRRGLRQRRLRPWPGLRPACARGSPGSWPTAPRRKPGCRYLRTHRTGRPGLRPGSCPEPDSRAVGRPVDGRCRS